MNQTNSSSGMSPICFGPVEEWHRAVEIRVCRIPELGEQFVATLLEGLDDRRPAIGRFRKPTAAKNRFSLERVTSSICSMTNIQARLSAVLERSCGLSEHSASGYARSTLSVVAASFSNVLRNRSFSEIAVRDEIGVAEVVIVGDG